MRSKAISGIVIFLVGSFLALFLSGCNGDVVAPQDPAQTPVIMSECDKESAYDAEAYNIASQRSNASGLIERQV